jgi:F-type H+-transporting ATPase subunit a
MIGMVPVPHLSTGESFYDYNHNETYDPGEFDRNSDTNGNGIHDAGFQIPAFEEPTSNLNVPLGMALLFVVLIGHGSEIRIHGIGGYIKSYFSPEGLIGILMFPLNLVGKIAEVVSISFRLFGNIFGGVVIISVVSGLLHYMFMPIGLYGFFGIFVGTVQAFVFTMLALTYISMGAAEEE